MTRSGRGQSLAEYAIGIGCVAALVMVALSNLGLIGSKMLHKMEHGFNGFGHGQGGATSHHAHPIVDVTATPWEIN